ncbi:hypothetical protein H6F43_04215 [Leptolyngbya sp. FACHB-36]|uniref:hypothetical protein n=1 Tax=Leptolyngbya sp. FACHB-36 TaxID=2692808 RepID=UPI001681A4A7|nr:hypothetical protein [Leptolyngbya sp. FACHB-36]MBD2019388.1 hypothetical protein [Leptolyngbya sp. FACHB-36]
MLFSNISLQLAPQPQTRSTVSKSLPPLVQFPLSNADAALILALNEGAYIFGQKPH